MLKNNKIETGYRLFLDICCQQKQRQNMRLMLDFFLSPEEKYAISRRAALIQALLKGEMTQREIAEKLRVSIAKITRGSNMLKLIDNKTKNILIKGLIKSSKYKSSKYKVVI
jgi:TrpR family trp operon transcriptional repressor